jgi:hypothetical protein
MSRSASGGRSGSPSATFASGTIVARAGVPRAPSGWHTPRRDLRELLRDPLAAGTTLAGARQGEVAHRSRPRPSEIGCEPLPHACESLARLPQRRGPCCGDGEVALRPPPSLGCGVRHSRAKIALQLEAAERGIESPDRDVTSGARLDLLPNGHAVRLTTEARDGKEEVLFELAERVLAHAIIVVYLPFDVEEIEARQCVTHRAAALVLPERRKRVDARGTLGREQHREQRHH